MSLRKFAPWIQGLIYVVTGAWPIVHLRSFERMTGPKVDKWLVRTVGAVVLVHGFGLLSAAVQHRADGPVKGMAVGTALALAAIDVKYASTGRISKVYLLDAVLESFLAALWFMPSSDKGDSAPAAGATALIEA